MPGARSLIRPLLRATRGHAPRLAPACGGSDEPAGTGGASTSSSTTGQGGAGGGDGGAGGGGGAGGDPVPLSTAPRGAEATLELCSNGVDDDGNGYADCDDSWCRQTVEIWVCDALENTEAKCGDGVDNIESPRIPGGGRRAAVGSRDA